MQTHRKTDRHVDVTKLRVAFYDCVNAPKDYISVKCPEVFSWYTGFGNASRPLQTVWRV